MEDFLAVASNYFRITSCHVRYCPFSDEHYLKFLTGSLESDNSEPACNCHIPSNLRCTFFSHFSVLRMKMHLKFKELFFNSLENTTFLKEQLTSLVHIYSFLIIILFHSLPSNPLLRAGLCIKLYGVNLK